MKTPWIALGPIVLLVCTLAGCCHSGSHAWRTRNTCGSGNCWQACGSSNSCQGGGSGNSWQSTFYSSGGYATLDTTGVELVFEAVPLPSGRATNRNSLRVSGGGTSRVTSTINGRTMSSSYADGVNSINVEGFAVTILDEGRRAQVGSQSFDLGGPKKTLAIHPDGTASVR